MTGGLWSTVPRITATSVCVVVEMVAMGKPTLSGFIKREEISLEGFP